MQQKILSQKLPRQSQLSSYCSYRKEDSQCFFCPVISNFEWEMWIQAPDPWTDWRSGAVPEGHMAAIVPTKASAMDLVPEPLLLLWEPPPYEDLSHSLRFFLHVRKQLAKQHDLDPERCLELQEKNKHMDLVPVKVWNDMWRKYSQAWAMLFQSEQKSVTRS